MSDFELLRYVNEEELNELERRAVEILEQILRDCENQDKINKALVWISSPDSEKVPEPVGSLIDFLEENELYRDEHVLHKAQANMSYAYYLLRFLNEWSKDVEMIEALKEFACRE